MIHKKKHIVFLFILVTFLNLKAQNNLSLIDSIIKQTPKNFIQIQNDLKPINNDSLALKYLLKKSKENHKLKLEVYALNILGKKERIQGKYGKSLQLYNQALNIAKKIKNPTFEIYTLNMIGVVYRRMDAVKSALEYHNKALNLALNQEKKSAEIEENIAISHNSIGNIYLLLERYDLAKNHFKKSMEIEKKYHNKLGLAINYQNIGSIYENEGNLEKALIFYKHSLKYNDSINSNIGKIICKTSIANILLKKNQAEKALKILEPSIKTAKKLGDTYYIADVYFNYGKILLKNRQYKQAEKYLLESLKISQSKNYPSIAAEIYKELSILNEIKNQPEKALAYYKLYNNEQKKIYNEKNRQLVSDLFLEQIKKESTKQIKKLDRFNKEVTQELKKSQTTILIIILLIILISILAFTMYKHNEIKNERKLLNMEQNLLRAQMNPHFIFNSLNSIKLYIIHNRSKDAISFLSKFAKLIRIILQSTKTKEMSLEEEIEMIKLYVSIENIRLNNSVKFFLEIDESLNLNQIKIPPLLTQPFIENALWHGLSNKDESDRILKIKIYKKNNSNAIIEIEDNGIGREKAEKIKKNKIFKKKSMGINLSNERLKLFAKTFNEYFNIKIVDLFHNKKPVGTKIIIEIPIHKQR